jgi:hypothetical protein
MSTADEKTYEMLWDCRFCGQKKNLGLSHRCCPGCGAPQDPSARYFPSDAEKVAAEDHPYLGADVLCPACRHANSRNSKCCSQCGGPLAAAQQVAVRADQVGQLFAGETAQDAKREFAAPVPTATPARKPGSPLAWIVPLAIVALIAVMLFVVFRKRDGAFVIADKSWDRTVDVEQRALVRTSEWCDSMPAGSVAVARHREQRSTKQVPDGQTCATRRKDQGNGTFKEVRECTPKTKTEAVMDDKCDYNAEAWKPARTAKAHGGDKDPPAWPATSLARSGCVAIGCEREASRTETYAADVREAKTGAKSSCKFDVAQWSRLHVGDPVVGRIGAVTKSVDCDSIVVK